MVKSDPLPDDSEMVEWARRLWDIPAVQEAPLVPLPAALAGWRLIDIHQTAGIVGVTPDEISMMALAGTDGFPAPIPVGEFGVAWKLADILGWIDRQRITDTKAIIKARRALDKHRSEVREAWAVLKQEAVHGD